MVIVETVDLVFLVTILQKFTPHDIRRAQCTDFFQNICIIIIGDRPKRLNNLGCIMSDRIFQKCKNSFHIQLCIKGDYKISNLNKICPTGPLFHFAAAPHLKVFRRCTDEYLYRCRLSTASICPPQLPISDFERTNTPIHYLAISTRCILGN